MQDPSSALMSIMQQPREVMSLPAAMRLLQEGKLERPPDAEGLAAVVMAPRDSIQIR